MKKSDLFELIQDSIFIKDEIKEPLLKSISGDRVIDILFHFPKYYKILVKSNNLITTEESSIIRCKVKIINKKIEKGRFANKRRHIFDCIIKSSGEEITLVFFHIAENLLNKMNKDNEFIVTGKIENYKGKKCLNHPRLNFKIEENQNEFDLMKIIFPRDIDFNFEELENEKINSIETYYHLKEPIYQYSFKKIIKEIIRNIEEFKLFEEDFLNISSEIFPNFLESIKKIHFPENYEEIKPNSIYFKNLAFYEVLSSNLSLNLIRSESKEKEGISIVGTGELINKALKIIRFELTNDQKNAFEEIKEEQKNKKRMSRLLQGDVGCGKTIVALLTALNTIEAGLNVMILAPTSILATQHYESFKNICDELNLEIALITGSTTKKEKDKIFSLIRMGFIKILIGTHALFYIEELNFEKFGLFIIDEQHQFGVQQRYDFVNKNKNSDTLMMTATPIPRTLLLSIYGDISISTIKEKPSNRKEIDTRIISLDRYEEVKKSVQNLLNKNGKVYWVCKLVQKDNEEDLIFFRNKYENVTDIKTRITDLKKAIKKFNIEYIHGGLKNKEKDKIMQDFKENKTHMLISTTVIEVGVNVPEANLIIIENAEMFGLAQLHQLRGRVGRGERESYCLLLHSKNLSENGKKRLEILKKYSDGFLIAEADLEMRGGGDIIGNSQSGFNIFKFFSFSLDKDLMQEVYRNSNSLIKKYKSEEDSSKEIVDFFFNIFSRNIKKSGINLT